MKITCQSCNSKYNVADEKVQGKTVKIRCRKCGATIVVHGAPAASANGSAPASGAPAPPVPGDDAQWHVNVTDNDQRTMSLADLVGAYETGVVTLETFVWTDGMEDWKPLSEVEAVVGASRAANAPAAAATAARSNDTSTPATAVPDYEASSGAGVGYDAPAPAQEAGPSYGDRPAGESVAAATPEPRRAAVVKREARARDLFGTNVGDDMQASAQAAADILAAPPPLDDGRFTGQRNENSVLFSLEVLTKSAEQRAPQDKASTKDDSGIIDLKALAAKAESMRPISASHLDTFAAPLAMASAPFGTMGGSNAEGSRRSKLPLLIGGGAGIAILLVLGIVIGIRMGGTSGSSPAANSTASTAPSAAEPVGTASATTESTAAASVALPPPAYAASGPAGAAGAPNVKPHAGAGTGAAGAHVSAGAQPAKPVTAGGGAAATGAAAPPPAAPKKGGDCGCNGDLMCLMKCSTSH